MEQPQLPGIGPFPEEPLKGASAVVVFSGGQDSVTCLGYALKHFETVHTVGFAYGQTHEIELKQARKIANDYGVPFTLIDIPALSQLGDSALTTGGDVNAAHHRDKELPASFVPNRNALFLTIAHAYAQKIGALNVITGVCQTDYSGYPDCRESFITVMQNALNIGYRTKIQFITPLMHLNKAQTFELAAACNVLGTVISDSHTCYNGDRETVHEWGAGCGKCPACVLRANGWEEYKVMKGVQV